MGRLIAAGNALLERMQSALGAGANPNLCTEGSRHTRPVSLFQLLMGTAEPGGIDDAKDEQRVACLRLLVQRGGVIDAAMATQCLWEACIANRSPAVVCWLLEEGGADVNSRRKGGKRPLHLTQRADVAEVLLAAGADAHVRDKSGRTPLHNFMARSSKCSQSRFMTVVVEAGVDIDARSADGSTALHMWAAQAHEARLDLLMELLRLGADASLLSSSGKTALEEALASVAAATAFEYDFERAFGGVAARTAAEHAADGGDDVLALGPALRGGSARLTPFVFQFAVKTLARAAAWYRRRHMLLAIRGRA